jgi:hypothetical protein
MKRTRIALVLVGVLALVGGGTALAGKGKSKRSTPGGAFVAAARGMHGPGDDLVAAASYLGTTTDNLVTQLQSGKTLAQIADATSGKSASGLVAALVANEKTEIASAVSAGKLTQAQADQLTASLQQRFTDLVDGTFPPHGPGGPDHMRLDLLATAATYLGTTESALLSQLQSGKSLAQIANAASGKSASGLVDALVAAAKQQLGSNAPSDLQQRITDLVNGMHPPGPFGRDHRGFGPPPGGAPAAGTFGFRHSFSPPGAGTSTF